MLALRLARGAHSLVQLRRLLVAAASAGTGFLLLCTLGYALAHPDPSAGALLRLLWCLAPVAATVHFAVAVARTDPGTRPRPGLSAVGLGPGQLMAISAVTTALSTTLGSVLALLAFLHLRGDLPGRPFDGDPAAFLASDHPLPLPAALTLLLLVPLAASSASRVWAEGPYGALTAERHTGRKALLIAGGVGITPLRALFETLPGGPGDVTLLYRASTAEDLALGAELEAIAQWRGARVLYAVNGADGTRPRFTAESLRASVPGLAGHDVYLCDRPLHDALPPFRKRRPRDPGPV
ncbi:hypothetical protein ABT086_28790, partial [Streptomyces mirabilis]